MEFVKKYSGWIVVGVVAVAATAATVISKMASTSTELVEE